MPFREFLDIESNMDLYCHPPALLRYITNTEFPIIKSIVVDTRGLIIQITCKPYKKGGISQIFKKWTGFFGKSKPEPEQSEEVRGRIIVLKEGSIKEFDLMIKSKIDLFKNVKK